jgi:iron complex transport system ATP-binding protein
LAFRDGSADRIARLALERVGMADKERRRLSTLSGGERQMVHLARALAQIWECPQGLLFLDEPITHLDLHFQQRLLGIIRDLAAGGVGVVAVLHDLNLAQSHGDRFILLKQGALAGSADSLSAEMIEHLFEVRVRSVPGWQIY